MKLNEHQLKLFEDLTQLNGIAGQEDEIRNYLKKAYTELGYELMFDNLGSVIAVKRSKNKKAKKVFLVAHMDEVGFMVSNILPNGMLKANAVGGLNSDFCFTTSFAKRNGNGKN